MLTDSGRPLVTSNSMARQEVVFADHLINYVGPVMV